MEISHIISEMVLASAGFYTFYANLRKLNRIDKILWGTFILTVAFAALCASLRYAGFIEMGLLNIFIKKISASAGVLYLIIGVYHLVINKQLSQEVVYGIIILGVILSFILITFNFQKVIDLIPTIGIPMVLILGLWAIKLRKYKIGLYILLGTFFSIIANFLYLFDLPFNQIDAYCLVLAATLICFGLARKSKNQLL